MRLEIQVAFDSPSDVSIAFDLFFRHIFISFQDGQIFPGGANFVFDCFPVAHETAFVSPYLEIIV